MLIWGGKYILFSSESLDHPHSGRVCVSLVCNICAWNLQSYFLLISFCVYQ